jgi:RNA polymerase sigma-70 factor (sigma-E family)
MDRDAEFDQYVADSFARLCRTGYLFCGDWQRAEDAAQETLLKMYGSWRRIERREGRDAFARTALVRTLIDDWRRPWSRRERVDDDLVGTSSGRPLVRSVDAMRQVDDRDSLVRALAELTPRRRACIVLRFYLDASVTDTAAALGCSEGNVKRLTSDALAALRGALDEPERSHS